MDKFDICIVGAGVIGLAIAKHLSSFQPQRNRSVVILERDSGFGRHISSRNSEVIHAGIYYRPGSLKSIFCVRGKQLLYEHCETFQIAYNRIGKYIVAQQDQEQDLQELDINAKSNGVDDLLWISRSELKTAEPAVTGSHALFSPSTGIVDSHGYMQSLLHIAQNQNAEFAPFTNIQCIEWDAGAFTITSTVRSGKKSERYCFQSVLLINCAGLDSAKVARSIFASQAIPVPEIYFCKGDYFAYASKSPFQHLVYPMPDTNTTGLGIHATLDLAGRLRFGPDTEFVDVVDYDINSQKAADFARAISRYFPAISAQDLLPAYAGIRPKLAPAGSPAQDFYIQDGSDFAVPGLIQLFGIESPGLTASLAIGEYVDSIVRKLGV